MSSLRRLTQSLTKIISTNLKKDASKIISNKSRTLQQTRMMCSQLKEEELKTENKLQLGTIKAKLRLSFTCKKCNTRNHKTISKLAYEKGLVIVTCEGCKNNHLISDNLGWFAEFQGVKNIEGFLRKKGENVCRIRNNVDGYFEAITKEELDKAHKERKRIEMLHKVDDDK